MSSTFREEGPDPETGAGPDGRGAAAEVLAARHHLQQRAEEEHGAAAAAPRAPHAPAGSQALQKARADPAAAEGRAPAVRQGLLGQPPAAGEDASRRLCAFKFVKTGDSPPRLFIFQVANLNGRDNTFTLKDVLYKEIQKDWPGYTEGDQQLLKRILFR